MPRPPSLPTAVEWAHQLLERTLPSSAIVVDATAGNGQDALFLSRFTEPDGHLFALDLQPAAIENTQRLLLANGVSPTRFSLLQVGHENLASLLPEEFRGRINAFLFNLGYLPGENKSLTTLAHTTLRALNAATEFLHSSGLLCVVAYPGHPAGLEECQAVTQWMLDLPGSDFEVQHIRACNRSSPPPEVWLAMRRSTPRI